MASASVTLYFILSNLVTLLFLSSAETCPSTFQCGTLGKFGYPFTTFFNPACGICVINCTDTTPTIGLSAKGPWYEILNTFTNNKTFLVADKLLEYVTNADTCEAFRKDTVSLPKSSAVTFTVLYNETFWKCQKNFSRSSSFRRVLECQNYSIYHTNNSDDNSSLPNCTIFHYPQYLMVELSGICSNCVSEGGYCQEPEHNKFQCINKRKERRKHRLILGLGISGGSNIIVILGLLFLCLKKIKLRSVGLASEKISKQTRRTKTNIDGSKVYFSVPVFSYSELEEATSNFDPSRELGDGGFGTVYYGKN